MARKSKQDVAKAKAAKQKKIAIGGAVLLVGLLAIQLPKMMKMMNSKPKPPIVSAVPTDPNATVTPADPNTLAAPTLGGSTPTTGVAVTPTTSPTDLVSAVPVTADPGQLQSFERFATKDPFAAQADASGAPAAGGAGSGPKTTPTGTGTTPTTPTATTPAPPTPPAPAPSSAVISLNGELMSVGVATDFPQSGATFTRVGAIFHLVSLSAKTAKIAIVGGSYADGAAAITLHLKVPLTLQNTADGMKYTFILEPAGTPVVSTATSPTGTSTTSVVPPSSSGSGG